jgi:hypothetical protein
VVFEKLENFLTSVSIPASEWFAGAEQAVIAIYNLCENPDLFAAGIIKKLAFRIFPATFPKG